jgi:hypothetical protein
MREHTFLVLGAFTVAFLLVFGYCLYMIERCVREAWLAVSAGFRESLYVLSRAQRHVWL